MATEPSLHSSATSATISSSSTTMNAAAIPSPSSIPFDQLHNAITIKLDRSNFILWKAQLLPYLQGYNLERFVTGSCPCPPVKNSDGSPNPAVADWLLLDKLLLGWILSSLTAPILAKVAQCQSSAAAWYVLERTFASKTESNILHIKRELQHIKKGNLSMSDFLDNAKRLADSLAVAGHPISDMELRHCILDGLDSSYESVYATLTATMSSWSIEDFESYLITYERHLDTVNKSLLSQPQAHATKSSSSRGRDHSITANGNPVIICQLCDKPYHSCQDCYRRFDRAFKPPRKQPPKKGSRSPNDSSSTPAAYTTQSNSVYTYDWLPDSGASNHMTHSINNLHNQSEYTGPDQVRVASGSNMPISHTGSANRASSTSGHT
ncbi:hypothetical protein LguiA_006212 [Lonicera macranthoides]